MLMLPIWVIRMALVLLLHSMRREICSLLVLLVTMVPVIWHRVAAPFTCLVLLTIISPLAVCRQLYPYIPKALCCS